MSAPLAPENPFYPQSLEQGRLRAMDSAIEMFGRYWSVDGDILRCRACHSGQLASKADKAFVHSSDCVEAQRSLSHPWHTLARLLGSLPPVEQ